MIFLYGLLALSILPSWAMAGACDSLPGATIRVGCSEVCFSPPGDEEEGDFLSAFEEAAKKRGLSLKFVRLREEEDFSKVDAWVSPGGHDIDPKFYTQKLKSGERARIKALHEKIGNLDEVGLEPKLRAEVQKYRRTRDELEFRLMKGYLKKRHQLPYLGVCYGMQMLAGASGVPLVVDLKEELGIEARVETDRVDLLPGNSFLPFFGGKNVIEAAPQNHHQAVDFRYFSGPEGRDSSLRITAHSNEAKIPEMIEHEFVPAIGVQFHSEWSAFEELKLLPFEWLLERTCERMARLRKNSSKAAKRLSSPRVKP